MKRVSCIFLSSKEVMTPVSSGLAGSDFIHFLVFFVEEGLVGDSNFPHDV